MRAKVDVVAARSISAINAERLTSRMTPNLNETRVAGTMRAPDRTTMNKPDKKDTERPLLDVALVVGRQPFIPK